MKFIYEVNSNYKNHSGSSVLGKNGDFFAEKGD